MTGCDETTRCPDCGVSLVTTLEEMCCPRCGLVSGARITAEEPTLFRHLSRYGQNMVGCTIPWYDERSSIDLGSRDTVPESERALLVCLAMVRHAASQLGMPSGRAMVLKEARNTVKRLFRREDVMRMRSAYLVSTATIAAFSLVMAARLHRVNRIALQDVLKVCDDMGDPVSPLDLRRLIDLQGGVPRPTQAREFVSMVVSRLSASDHSHRLTSVTYVLLSEAEKDPEKMARSPRPLAVAAVCAGETLLSRREQRAPLFTIRAATRDVGVAYHTVREHYKLVFEPMLSSLVVAGPVSDYKPGPPLREA